MQRRDFVKGAGMVVAVGSTAMAGCLGDDDSDMEGEPVEGIELIVTTADYDPVRYEFGQLVASNWEELGFEVDVNPMAWNTIVDEVMDQQDFDAFTLNWGGRAERIDPDVFCYDLHHSSQTDPGARNQVNYQNPEYDEYAEEQRRTYDDEERREAVYKCQEIFAEDQPRTPIANQQQIMPYLEDRWDNVVTMMGEGLMSFWTAVDSEPADGVTELRLGYPSDVNNLNPADGQATHDQQTMRLIYDRLVRVNPDGVAEEWVAESVEEVDDTTIDVTIRDGLTWHDGEDLTVEDVAFSFEYLGEHSPVLSAATDPIEDVEIVDDSTVRFSLEEPFAPFIAVTLGQVFLIPRHVWEGVDNPLDDDNPEPVGSGPFQFDAWARDEQMVLTAFDDHFRPPNVDTLIKVPGSDMSSLVRMIEDEELDMIGWVPGPDTVNRLEEDVDHVANSSIEDHGWYHINYQLERPPFDRKEIRHALANGIPKQDIVDVVMDGMGTVAHSPIAEVNEFWHNPDTKQFGDDLDQARQVLEDAGYQWDSSGRLYYPAE